MKEQQPQTGEPHTQRTASSRWTAQSARAHGQGLRPLALRQRPAMYPRACAGTRPRSLPRSCGAPRPKLGVLVPRRPTPHPSNHYSWLEPPARRAPPTREEHGAAGRSNPGTIGGKAWKARTFGQVTVTPQGGRCPSWVSRKWGLWAVREVTPRAWKPFSLCWLVEQGAGEALAV